MVDLDSVYDERNKLALLVMRMAFAMNLPAGIGFDEQGEEGFKHVVYVNLPEVGQVSWHIPDSLLEQFKDAPLHRYYMPWDGHDTPEKYRRVMAAFPRGTWAW